MKMIGIAGGSGAGKSSVARALVAGDPERFERLCIDDYHKLRPDPDLPMVGDIVNWDHPDIIRWDRLLSDIDSLKRGKPITIDVKGPNYAETLKRVPRTISPKPVLIVEGYMTLYNPEVFNQFDESFYLDLDQATRASRRNKNKIIDVPGYPEKVWAPMHKKYIEPTRANAGVVIDIAGMSIQDICDRIRTVADV
jgi:uridine kinase